MAEWVACQTAKKEVGSSNPSIPPHAETRMWGRRTRCESQGTYITYTSTKFEQGRTHSGFETQRRHDQKSKTGVSVAAQMEMCPTKI